MILPHCLLLATLLPTASADPPDPRFEHPVQEDQDVRLTIWYALEELPPSFLFRHHEGEDGRPIPFDPVVSCTGATWCEPDIGCMTGEDPDCSDCDDDGLPECAAGSPCAPTCYFTDLDPCVAPGEVYYDLRADGTGLLITFTSLTVTDSGDDCLQPDSETDTDAPADSGEAPRDRGAPGGGCGGCASTTEGSHQLALPGALLALGLSFRRRIPRP